MRLLPAVRRAVAEIDPNRPLGNPRTLESHLAEQIQYPRYYSMLLGLFAFVATLLAAVGIYGVMAYAVEQRTREIGIRMALGADGWRVLRLVIRQAIWMIAAGLALGLGGAMALTRFISSELWEVQSTDPATFAGVSLLLIARRPARLPGPDAPGGASGSYDRPALRIGRTLVPLPLVAAHQSPPKPRWNERADPPAGCDKLPMDTHSKCKRRPAMKKNSTVAQSPKRASRSEARADHNRHGPGRQDQPVLRAGRATARWCRKAAWPRPGKP